MSQRVTIKNIKTGPSMEYGANGSYTATVYFDGKRTMNIFEAGSGGPLNFETVHNEDAYKAMISFIEKEIKPTDELYQRINLMSVVECHLGTMVNDTLQERDMKRACKKNIVAFIKSEPRGFVSYKCGFTVRNAEKIKKQEGDNLVEIVNYRFAQPV